MDYTEFELEAWELEEQQYVSELSALNDKSEGEY
jgi:hypothetical protein|tara:strand:+ start:2045 stop:2146 length:102 start_codon:yes stop_codon:yes gene_type:complete